MAVLQLALARWMLQYNACHSSFLNSTLHGRSGAVRASMVAYKMRPAIIEWRVSATANRSTVSSWRDAMRHPVLSTRCQASGAWASDAVDGRICRHGGKSSGGVQRFAVVKYLAMNAPFTVTFDRVTRFVAHGSNGSTLPKNGPYYVSRSTRAVPVLMDIPLNHMSSRHSSRQALAEGVFCSFRTRSKTGRNRSAWLPVLRSRIAGRSVPIQA